MFSDYVIADCPIRFADAAYDPVATGLHGFRPFAVSCDENRRPIAEFRLDVPIDSSYFSVPLLHEFDFPDADAVCRFAREGDTYIYYMTPRRGREVVFLYRRGSALVESNIALGGRIDPSLLRFGLWFMFGLAAAPQGVMAVHSSVVECRGAAVLFLGESGTGKSTHTRLWRENIAGARLLNDDSPIIRVGADKGEAVVYGSAWSGKTPCYRNTSLPIKAVVRLSQAPANSISRCGNLPAMGQVLPSLPPAFQYDADLQDDSLSILSQLIASVPVYHLGCLPDADAARLAYDTVFGYGDNR